MYLVIISFLFMSKITKKILYDGQTVAFHNKNIRTEICEELDISKPMLCKYNKKGFFVFDDRGIIDKEQTIRNIKKSNSLTLVSERRHFEKAQKRKLERELREQKNETFVVNNLSFDNTLGLRTLRENKEKFDNMSEQDDLLKKYEKGELSVADLLKSFDLDVIRKIEIVEKSRKQKIDNDEKEGKLISRQVVEAQLETLGNFLNSRIFEIPNRLCGELAGMRDQVEIKIFLKEELTQIFRDFERDLIKIYDK